MRFRNSLELILYKTYADLRAETARSYLGIIWWVIEPILYLGAYYILFVLVLHHGDADFVATFLCGAIAWKWFDSGIKGGSQSISAHAGLLQQVYVPKYVFPVIATLGSSIRFLPVFLIFMVFLLVSGKYVHVTWLAVPLLMIVQFALVVSLAMLAGAITPFLPDIRVAIDHGMMVLFFISGIFFNINDAHEPIRTYLLLNPMADIIIEYRNIMIHGVWPDGWRLSAIFLSAIILGSMALLLLKQLDHKYGKVRF